MCLSEFLKRTSFGSKNTLPSFRVNLQANVPFDPVCAEGVLPFLFANLIRSSFEEISLSFGRSFFFEKFFYNFFFQTAIQTATCH